MKNNLAACLVLCLSLIRCQAAETKPARDLHSVKQVLIQFLKLNQKSALASPPARQLLTGEARQHWKMASFGPLPTTPDKVVAIDATHAVARVQSGAENGFVTDLYFYVDFQKGWKISAMRALALTGIIEQAGEELKRKQNLTTTEQAEKANIELTLSSDRELKAYFTAHRAAFQTLSVLAARSPKNAAVAQAVKSLHLGGVHNGGRGNLEFVIGGMVDNTVGYLYSPSNTPPRIDPSEYIWVEKIADQWYLFRTT